MKTSIIVKTYISRDLETIVKINDNLEFSIIPEQCINDNSLCNLHIKKVKGDFDIEKVSWSLGECEINKETNSFKQKLSFIDNSHTFYVSTDVKFNEIISAIYELQIDKAKIQYLNEFEYFRGKIILTDFSNKEFEYLIKRNSADFVEVIVINPDGARINGQTGDYTFHESIDESINHKLSFIFEVKEPENICHAEDEKLNIFLPPPEYSSLNPTEPKFSYEYFKAALEFTGKWDFESSENLEDYLKAVNVGLLYRKVAINLRPQIVIHVNANYWHMESKTAIQDTVIEFELGKEFEQITADGRKLLSTFMFDENNGKLHQIQKATKCDEADSVIDRYVENGKLFIEMECNGIKAKCVYNRVA